MPTTEAPRTSRHEHAREAPVDTGFQLGEFIMIMVSFVIAAITMWPLLLVAGVAYLVYKVSGMSDVVAEARAAKSVEG